MSNLLLIGKSGMTASRAALELTAQNIANASNPDYARRTLSVEEVSSRGGISLEPGATVSGVRISQVLRTNSLFLQSEARRTAGDLSRADAELEGLRNAESAIEQAGFHDAIVDFEASLSRLASDPVSSSLRTAVLEDARRLGETFRIATNGLDIAESDLQFSAAGGVEQFNLYAAELARTNAGIARATPGTSNMAVLHDQRDALLRDMSKLSGTTATLDALGRATVTVGGQTMVSGVDAQTLSMTQNADGTLAFAVNGTAVTLSSGELLGKSQALSGIANTRTQLDGLANQVITLTNNAQANGAALDGTAGQPFFSGTGASDITLALTAGGQIATAPAGSTAGSRDIGNLTALRNALSDNGPATTADSLLFSISSGINSRSVTRDALSTIAETAATALADETGVDLDEEAANLLRFQQAFEANGRVIQIAAELFDTLLGIG